MKLALVDDHEVFREGLRALLSAERDLQVVAEAGDARQAFAEVERTRPDVVLLDIGMPGTDGLTAVAELQARTPQARVLMLSMYEREDYIARALLAGARGYAIKSQPLRELTEAIRKVARGGQYLPPTVSPSAVRETVDAMRQHGGDGPFAVLSDRERQVCDLLVRGLDNEEISQQLCISVRTVETHRARILRKTRAGSVAALIRIAARAGLRID